MSYATFAFLHERKRSVRLSLTPLIDCVFILLVFFMLQTNLLRPQSIEIRHAEGNSSSISDLTTITVELHANGGIWVNGNKSNYEGLHSLSASINEPDNVHVILSIDPGVKLQRIVNITDLFNHYDIVNIAMTKARNFE